jgi:hypothetical protein
MHDEMMDLIDDDEMMDLTDVSNEIQENLGRSYNLQDDINEEELMGGN